MYMADLEWKEVYLILSFSNNELIDTLAGEWNMVKVIYVYIYVWIYLSPSDVCNKITNDISASDCNY